MQLPRDQYDTNPIPSNTIEIVEKFVTAVEQTRANFKRTYRKDNLTRKERQALNKFINRGYKRYIKNTTLFHSVNDFIHWQKTVWIHN